MARINPPLLSFFLLLIFTAIPLPAAQSLSFSQYKTFFALAHSVTTRVANIRAARGDVFGSNRARAIADKLDKGMGLGLGLGFWGGVWSVGWDHVRNYAWRDLDYSELYSAVSEMNELMSLLSELNREESKMERAAWLGRNYGNVLRVAKSLSSRLLRVFNKSGPVREAMQTIQKELLDGDFLRDCLELGGNDLKSLVQILKDWALQYYPSSSFPNEL